MTLTELHAALDQWGPDLSTWPSHLTEPALDLISVSNTAKDLFAAAVAASLDARAIPSTDLPSATDGIRASG